MRGKVLAFDDRLGEGHISGDDGQRYRFAAAEWRPRGAPSAGLQVDFETDGREAQAVYPLGPELHARGKSRISAALLAFFLGALGIHKFYLDRNGAGLVMLLISLAGIAVAGVPSGLMALIGIIEAILYLVRSDAEFDRLYVQGNKSWF
ncbi:TM2 domain-containing protein [Sphingomonas sp.]|uniref:TM2 domain-containing protein n=1 Tax=Sphingomonas sp. TaxID=28214 RepID=UPI001B19E0FF|nr:TM2 domain-containing protein [Sphingomonas sp.]MBO9713746.1 TM2 domain-containing protein [Sphingomonas sp.]